MRNIYKYTVYLFIIFLLSSTNVYASCTDSELSKFKQVKDQYTVTYEIEENKETYSLYFKAPMPNNFYYEIYSDIELKCDNVDDNTLKCTNFSHGYYQIIVTGITKECNDILKTIGLELPAYNKLADDPLCEGIENFVLCKPTYDKEISYEDFVSRVNTYKKNHSTEQENNSDNNDLPNDQEEKKQNEFITKIINYTKTYLVETIIVVIFIILLTITIIITAKSIRKSRRLE